MLDDIEVALIKGMLGRGDLQHDIAAFFGVNSGRVAEIATGERGGGVTAAKEKNLPPRALVHRVSPYKHWKLDRESD